MPIHIRGNRHNLGAVVRRHYLQIIAGENHPPIQTNQSGRLELARWIASPTNALTARVMVNRIWQGHFGTGLVATSDNFGVRGELPSHPELLDWLASRFVESGWSVKALHRLLVLSSTYQQSSSAERRAPSANLPTLPSALRASRSALAAARSVDPDNRLLRHMPRRRLEAEAIRDSLLAVSGQLDRTIGGGGREMESVIQTAEAIDPKRGFYVPRVKSDDECYHSSRRSIYLPVIRNALPDALALFDAADANNVTTARNDTTVPTQAMFMLNNSLVREQALHFARSLLRDVKATDAERIQACYARALGRAPTGEELADAARFLKEYAAKARALDRSEAGSRLTAWQSLCQMLFCANEFLYLD